RWGTAIDPGLILSIIDNMIMCINKTRNQCLIFKIEHLVSLDRFISDTSGSSSKDICVIIPFVTATERAMVSWESIVNIVAFLMSKSTFSITLPSLVFSFEWVTV